MRVFVKILLGVVVAAMIYSGVLLTERMATQELTRATHPSSQEVVCVMWRPRFLQGDGVCFLELRDANDEVVDSAELGTLSAAFEALQQYGQLGFQSEELLVTNQRTGQIEHRFVVREERLSRVP